VVKLIDRLLHDYLDSEVASILNERGFHTGTGLPLTGARVRDLQRKYGLKTRHERLRARGLLTIEEVAKRLNIFVGTARVWQKKGLLIRHAYTRNKYLYEPPFDHTAFERYKHFKNRPPLNEFTENQQDSGKEVQYER